MPEIDDEAMREFVLARKDGTEPMTAEDRMLWWAAHAIERLEGEVAAAESLVRMMEKEGTPQLIEARRLAHQIWAEGMGEDPAPEATSLHELLFAILGELKGRKGS